MPQTLRRSSLARERTYRYSYDFAARLTSASYLEGSVAKASFSGSYQYDAGGNLTSITEGGTTLSPVISGNRIDRIGTSACTYDAKGRQISSAHDGRTVVYNLLDRPQKITLSGSEVLSNTFDYEKGEFKVNSFKDVQYKTFIGLSSDLLIPGIDRSFRPLKTTTVNQSMKRAMKDSKYTPELYSKVRARTNASNALKTDLNDVAEDAVRSFTTDVGKSVMQKLYDKDSEEEELKYGW